MGLPVFDGSTRPAPVGHYSYRVADDAWVWSDGVYTLHGYAPREVPATLQTLLSHKHPDDVDRVVDVIQTALQNGQPYSCYHRIIDRHERVRSVLGVGRGYHDDQGKVARLEGFYLDLTDLRRDETQAQVQSALAGISEHGREIEQAKGVLMATFGCDADTAFAMLRSSSQDANFKLHQVARNLLNVGPARLVPDERSRAAVNAFLTHPGVI